jgi:hypothetical protein
MIVDNRLVGSVEVDAKSNHVAGNYEQ